MLTLGTIWPCTLTGSAMGVRLLGGGSDCAKRRSSCWAMAGSAASGELTGVSVDAVPKVVVVALVVVLAVSNLAGSPGVLSSVCCVVNLSFSSVNSA